MSAFSGLFVATLTPFDSANRVDPAVIRGHTRFLIEAGVAGICPCGTTGEWLYLTHTEKVWAIEWSVAAANGEIRVVAGIAALQEREIALLAQAAESAGADAVFLTPPIYYPASDDVIFTHYARVRECCALPVFAYNIPSHAANAISLNCVERLVTENVIAGIKDSTADSGRMEAMVTRFGSRITVLAASDSFAAQGRRLGAHGFISALANVWPRSFASLWAGDDSLQPAVDSARAAVKQNGGIPALKALAALRGFNFGASRMPGASLSDAGRESLASTYAAATATGLR